ncbi:alpha-1,2-fucosyltransferase [Pedobacter panaciterrae]|uniref:alpha-1,2-fucosyltransferase n=1 Tax=Pedobacter panaciterrae TaxID=363849 RepID=UPI0025914751|nr:alpha-1,2-fucosyltransferase [uncultured Pedobacter sp.]
MFILRINGGLGNQMFQYAFGRVLADKYSQQMCIDFSQFQDSNRTYSLDMFPLNDLVLNDIDAIDLASRKTLELQEEDFKFCPDALNVFEGYDLKNNFFLVSGYWQSPKYFSTILPIVKNDFRHIYLIDQKYDYLNTLISGTESVMVHIRRGDYLLYGNLEKHGVIDIDYVKRGMNYYRKLLTHARFFIFSDDPAWCRTNIPQCKEVIFVDQDSDQGKTSFSLMRQCKYFLISNSTFSWWAAYLSDFPDKKVICPKNWFREPNIDTRDLIPTNWIKI